MHPQDNRAVFIVPWEGAVLIGTTDLDHEGDLSVEPKITEQEATYLIEGVRALFPSLDLSLQLYRFIRRYPAGSQRRQIATV